MNKEEIQEEIQKHIEKYEKEGYSVLSYTRTIYGGYMFTIQKKSFFQRLLSFKVF